MASGTIKGTFTNLSASHLYPEIRWRSTKNDTNNNSSVTAELWFVRVNTAYISNNAYFLPRITINGNEAYPPNGTYAPFDMRKGTHKVWQRTVTVAHNADGAKSITIAAGGITGLSNLGNVSVSGTAKLDTIPRASSISSISGDQIGGSVTVNISRASSSFTHRVGYYDTDGQRRSAIIDAGTSGTFTIPIDRCSLLPNATSGTAKIIVDTYSGGTKIGSTSKNHTMYVPSSVVPSISHLTATEIDGTVKALNLGANNFVQNKSTIGLTAAATSPHGGTIRDYTFSYNGTSQGGTVGRNFAAGNVNGAKEVKVVVTDSRGRKAEKKFNVNVIAYSPPKINKFNVYRANDSTSVKADVSYTITDIASKGGTWYIDKLAGSTWTMTNSGTTTSTYTATVTLAGTYDGAKSHSFRTNLHDAFGKGATANGTVGTNKVALDLFKDVGIGVGKTYERGTLDVGGNTYINGNLYLDGGGSSSIKSTINWTPPNANATGVFTHLYRHNGKMLSALYHSTGDDTLGMNMYDQNGNYKINKFLPDGGVNFAGRIWSGSYITATGNITAGGIMYENGNKRVHADYTPQKLWSGAAHMGEGHRATATKPLSSCRNGWALYWSDYVVSTSTANNWDWNMTLIPKSAIETQGVNGFQSVVAHANSVAPIVKYMYLRDTYIDGNAHNTSTDAVKNVVLRAIYEF